MTDSYGSSRRARGGLTSCSRCQGVVPTTETRDVSGSALCEACARRVGAPASSTPPSSTSPPHAASAPAGRAFSAPAPIAGAPSAATVPPPPPVHAAPPVARERMPPPPGPRPFVPGAVAGGAPTIGGARAVTSPLSGSSAPAPFLSAGPPPRAPTPPAPAFAPPPAAPPVSVAAAPSPAPFAPPRAAGAAAAAAAAAPVASAPSSAPPLPAFGTPAFGAPVSSTPAIERPVAEGSRIVQTPRFRAGASDAGTLFSAQVETPKAPTLRDARVHMGGAPAATQTDAFAEYAALRQRIDAGEDTLEVRRRAAEIAAHLNFTLEALEHYERCAALDPSDLRMQMVLENVRRSAGVLTARDDAPTPQAEGRVAKESAPFWERLGDVLAWPLRGNGKGVLLVGGACFGVLQVLGAFNVYGWLIGIGLWGYIASYFFSVINVSARGRTSPPDLPESGYLLETYVFPFFTFLSCGVIAYLPFLLSLYVAAKGWLPPALVVAVAVLTFVLGAFVFPMVLLVCTMYQSLSEAANPGNVFGSIGRVLPDYLACYVALAVVWTACGVAHAALWFGFYLTLGAPTPDAVLSFDGVRVLSWLLYTLVSWPLFLYCWMLQGHLLGSLYAQGLQRLAWFVRPTDATLRARKMSTALWCGAGAAALLMCGVVWGAATLLRANGGRFGATAMLETCPVRNGSSLTYFWEHTDGGAGLTTYTFLGLPDGTLRVKAVTRWPDRSLPPTSDDVGVFDPASGAWLSAPRMGDGGGTIEGYPAEHVPFYGPKRASVGSTFVDDWPVRANVRWQDAWQAWKVTHPRTTAELYFDAASGVLVGRRMGGVGFVSTQWLVAAQNVPGVTPGPAPTYDFGDLSSGAPADGGASEATDDLLPTYGPSDDGGFDRYLEGR